MPDLPFSAPWALALLGAAIWTILFSLAQFPLRGLRNFGLLASMVPEAVEYLLADLGVLAPPTDPPSAPSSTEAVEES